MTISCIIRRGLQFTSPVTREGVAGHVCPKHSLPFPRAAIMLACYNDWHALLQATRGSCSSRGYNNWQALLQATIGCYEQLTHTTLSYYDLLRVTTGYEQLTHVWLLPWLTRAAASYLRLLRAGIMHGCYNNYKSTARATEPPVNSNSGNISRDTSHPESRSRSCLDQICIFYPIQTIFAFGSAD